MDEAAQGSSLGIGKDTLRKAGAVVNKSERKTLLPCIGLSRLGRQDKSVRQTMLCGVSHRAAFLFSVFWKRELGGVPPAVHESAPKNAAHPTNQGERFHKPKEKLYICTMNTQGLLALAQLILPSEILSNFEVVRVEEESSLIRIYLDESVRAEYKENPKIESKGFCDAVTIRDFPIRDKGVDLVVRRRKWYDRQNNRYFSDSYDLKAEGTRYSKEFAAFLKGVYGDDPYDLQFA